MSEPLIINQFDQAVAGSAHKGFGSMRLVDIDSYPGGIKANPAPTSIFHTSTTGTFTAVAATDVCTAAAFTTSANTTGIAVVLTTTGTLPAGLSASTVYFMIRVDQNAGTFKLATTIALANAETGINITDTGSGTHTITSIEPAQTNHIVRDSRTGFRFFLDSNGRVWYNDGSSAISFLLHNSAIDTGSGALTNAAGNGMVLFKQNDTGTTHHLLVFRNALIDIVDVYASADIETPVWTNGWQTLLISGPSSGNRHQALVGQDDIVYYTDDRMIGSIKEASGATFDPATSSTFVYTNNALDTLVGEVLVCLTELGTLLLAGASTSNKVYPWDRLSDSFSLPLFVPEQNVSRLKNVGNTVYILAGAQGNIYQTQGTYVRHFVKLPEQMTNNSGTVTASKITWGGFDAIEDALLVGAGVQTTGNSGAYKVYLDGRITLDQIPLSGSANVTAFEARTKLYYMGFSGGANVVGTTRYSGLESTVQSAFYRVATKTEKATYSVLEVVIAQPASAGNVRVGYRYDTSSSFTTLSTFTADGATTTFKNDEIGLIDVENIQIQAEIDDEVELVEIRLLP